MLLCKYWMEKFLENTAQKIYWKSRLCFLECIQYAFMYKNKQPTLGTKFCKLKLSVESLQTSDYVFNSKTDSKRNKNSTLCSAHCHVF